MIKHLLLIALLVTMAFIALFSIWRNYYIDLNSYKKKTNVVVMGMIVWQSVEKENELITWVRSVREIPNENWKFRFGNPVLWSACTLGGAEKNSMAINDIYKISKINSGLGEQWLKRLDSEPYPLSAKFLGLISDSLQDEYEKSLKDAPNESLHRTAK